MEQTIIKSRQGIPYTIVENNVLRDPELSAKAKGLFCYLQSLPDNWQINKKELCNHFKEGRDSIEKAFNELVDYGVIHGVQIIDSNGKFSKKEWVVYPSKSPLPENQAPLPENPSTENQALLNKDIINKEFIEKKKLIKEKKKVAVGGAVASSQQKFDWYISKVNQLLGKNFRLLNAKTKKALLARVREGYTSADFVKAIEHAMLDEYHISSGYRHLTPEFFTRQAMLDKWINASPKEQYNPLKHNLS